MNARKILTVGIAAIGFAVGVAHAQPGWGDGPEHYGHGNWDSRKPDPERMAQFRERHEKRLHDALKLTPAQEPAWQNFLGKIKPPQAAPARPDFEALSKLPTPERLDRMQAMAKEHQERMAVRVAATKEFYAQLTPDQQKVFDEQAMPRRGKAPKGKEGRPAASRPEQAPTK